MTVELNADRSLYEHLQRLSNMPRQLTDEEEVMLTSLKVDFERGGITLSDAERRGVTSVQNRINSLGAQFSHNVATESAYVEVPRAKLGPVAKYVVQSLPRSRRRDVFGRSNVLVPAGDPAITPLILKSVSDEDIRRKLYVAEHARCAQKNIPILDNLLACRSQLAKLLGAKSYSHLMFQGRVASSPEDVISFLENLSDMVEPFVGRESKLLTERKSAMERCDVSESLSPWDRSFYMSLERAKSLEVDVRTISEYLSLPSCLDGIAAVMKETFGVAICQVPRSLCESELWHDDVWKAEVHHDSAGHLGDIYFDLYPRKRKYGHAAHFCIRGGRDIGSGGGYQPPSVALVCNFARSSPGAPAFLTMSEYETLWHELAHAMHSVLSRTRFQHLSGTRVATDLVEIPSHIFELFARDPRVLSRIAVHCRTGDPMPSRYVSALTASRKQFVASDIQSQVLYSVMDLVFHGEEAPVGRTTEVAEALQGRLTRVPFVDGIAPQAAFQHFVGYGAGYYSCTFAAPWPP